MRDKPKRFIEWLINKLPKQEVTREVREKIKIKYPGYHLARNGSGRKKKNVWDLSASKIEGLGDLISKDYRTSHLGKFPGKNLGD